jgi:cytochrome c
MTSPARFAFVIALAGGVLATVQAQKSSDGRQLFQRRCGGCHARDRDKEGPRLRGVYGRSAGSVTSFPYSDALKNSGITWTAETLEQWLTDTDNLVPGSDMAFRVESAEERRAIIAYLKRKSDK